MYKQKFFFKCPAEMNAEYDLSRVKTLGCCIDLDFLFIYFFVR